MAVITMGNKKYPHNLKLTDKELNTLTIAIALLNVPDMEDEAKQQGLDLNQLEYSHLELFSVLTKKTRLYPQHYAVSDDGYSTMSIEDSRKL